MEGVLMLVVVCIGMCFNIISFVVYLRQKCHKTFHRLVGNILDNYYYIIVTSISVQIVATAGDRGHHPPGVLPPLLLYTDPLPLLPHHHLPPHPPLHPASSSGTVN